MAPDGRLRESTRRRYLKVDTATVADVLDVLGLPDQGLAPQFTPFPANAGRLGLHPRPGDFILADADGVIVVPARAAFKVLLEAERLTAKEIRIRRDLGRGASLEDVLKKYGHV